MSKFVRHFHQEGFTLVEIVIVLAITALLMILVFYDFQAGKVDQRNAQRKTDLAQIGQNLEKLRATSINNFQYPATPAIFDSYFDPLATGTHYSATKIALGFDSSAVDPLSRVVYNYDGSNGATGGPSSSKPADITYLIGTPCGIATPYAVNNPLYNSGIYRITISLEGGSYCIDNH